MDVMPFDELNKFEDGLSIHFEDGKIRSKQDAEDIIDEMFDLFLLSVATGQESANADLGVSVGLDSDTAVGIVETPVAGKTFRERVMEYFENGGDEYDIRRIAETEVHRAANEAAFETAKKAGAKTKTWETMMDDEVREDHTWLQGVTTPIDGYFYGPNGERTLYPGQWGVAEQDVNCRCFLTFS